MRNDRGRLSFSLSLNFTLTFAQVSFAFLHFLVQRCIGFEQIREPQELVRKLMRSGEDTEPASRAGWQMEDFFDEAKLVEFVANNNWRVFDPAAWQRR